MNVETRRDELAAEYRRENPDKPFQGYAPGTPEWEAAIIDASWNVALTESEIVEDASHLYHAANSNAQFIGATQPEHYQAILDKWSEDN